MRKMTLLAATAALILAGCSGSDGPRDVAQNFWDAAKSGDVEAVKLYTTRDSAEGMSLTNNGDTPDGEVMLGTAEVEGNRAAVPTTLNGYDATNPTASLNLQTVLVKEDGAWKVDFNQTMMSFFGGAMGEMMEQMGTAMAEGMQEMTEGMAEAMQDGMKEMQHNMEAATADH